jgi:TonB family protein
LRYALLLPLLALVFGLGMVQAQTAPDKKQENTILDYDNQLEVLNMQEVQAMVQYPAPALEAEIEGKVFVEVVFGQKGEYVRHEIKKSPDPVLSREIERVVPNLKGRPVTSHGKPVSYAVTIPFMFALGRK